MAQNITLLGASYTAVPAVTLPKTGGGTAKFSDASVTTAVESDVAEGKTFLLADGSIGIGTASGGGGSGYTRTVVVPEQTVTTLSDTWTLITANASIVDGEEYIVTVNGVEKISTATTHNGIIYISFIDFDWGGVGYAFGTAASGAGVYFMATAGTYTVKVEKLELT